ncbi:glutamate--cysteine ligase [Serratia symbiotica]|uniref:glutamate--cysteine ligase n=1 Tax=Serratia symbiotica TaxID=138074 RepID=UPI001D33E12F|nr:glutamate--cysteine ligase [Serratia symbiotica]NIG88218.1 glutamate--cysteine ligase [Serratia symbiotica]USS95049.1 glutamate--cysteine ligase [Serratia symbiotica]
MIPDVSQALSWLKAHPQALKGIRRGIERETLRVTPNGTLALTGHPENFGAALTHHWITTDFAEAMLEFITPVDDNLDHLLTFLRDIHRYVARNLGEERMWPLSMPCFIDADQDIELAQFGSSNIGRVKTLYREGLKNRYGALMQAISGVHYNFSLPLAFWQAWAGVEDVDSGKAQISAGYFSLIRNYYRFGWVIPYLFGASPAICSSFLKNRETDLVFECTEQGMCYLPYATSLRLSDLGYTNKSQSNLGINFNDLHSYVAGLKRAIVTPSETFAKLRVKEGDRYLQLNSNVLQIENELYAPIRPKRVTNSDETPSDALLRGGIEYIEVRSLDINPFSPIGVDAVQVRFLDLFLIWCVLVEASEMGSAELLCTRKNWNRVIMEGRKPGQSIDIGCDGSHEPLDKVGKALFDDLRRVAEVLDGEVGDRQYQQVCDELVAAFYNPELTFSARVLKAMTEESTGCVGLRLAEQYHEMLIEEPLEILNEAELVKEQEASWQRQRHIEASDTLSFEAFMQQNGSS